LLRVGQQLRGWLELGIQWRFQLQLWLGFLQFEFGWWYASASASVRVRPL
jgi:hypothetical protein